MQESSFNVTAWWEGAGGTGVVEGAQGKREPSFTSQSLKCTKDRLANVSKLKKIKIMLMSSPDY